MGICSQDSCEDILQVSLDLDFVCSRFAIWSFSCGLSGSDRSDRSGISNSSPTGLTGLSKRSDRSDPVKLLFGGFLAIASVSLRRAFCLEIASP